MTDRYIIKLTDKIAIRTLFIQYEQCHRNTVNNISYIFDAEHHLPGV